MLVGGGRGLRADLSPGAHPSRSSSEVTLGLDEGNCAMPKVDSQIYTLKAQVAQWVHGRLAFLRLLLPCTPLGASRRTSSIGLNRIDECDAGEILDSRGR